MYVLLRCQQTNYRVYVIFTRSFATPPSVETSTVQK